MCQPLNPQQLAATSNNKWQCSSSRAAEPKILPFPTANLKFSRRLAGVTSNRCARTCSILDSFRRRALDDAPGTSPLTEPAKQIGITSYFWCMNLDGFQWISPILVQLRGVRSKKMPTSCCEFVRFSLVDSRLFVSYRCTKTWSNCSVARREPRWVSREFMTNIARVNKKRTFPIGVASSWTGKDPS